MSNPKMLEDILAYKRHEVVRKQDRTSINQLEQCTRRARPPRDLKVALQQPGISLIAEVKGKSPSKGALRTGLDPVSLAGIYNRNGARAVAVLADQALFGGGAHVVQAVANAPEINLPVLYKEFVLDPYQVIEARACGADAVLLIVRALDEGLLRELIQLCYFMHMEALVEVFTLADAQLAQRAGARIIGINNRDLQTFQVDLRQSERIRAALPTGILTVSESGFRTRAEIIWAARTGFDAVLVGEAIITAEDVGAKVREMALMAA